MTVAFPERPEWFRHLSYVATQYMELPQASPIPTLYPDPSSGQAAWSGRGVRNGLGGRAGHRDGSGCVRLRRGRERRCGRDGGGR